MDLTAHIEAVLFYKAEPMKISTLARFFDTDQATIKEALETLRSRQQGGLVLTFDDHEAYLVTAPHVSETIDRLKQEEFSRDIGKAGAETLAIILYRGPISRSGIDLIRGVNSAFILRNLLMRGLIERIPHPTDKRQYQYKITTQLYTHLGITKKEELPEYEHIASELDRYEKEQQNTTTEEETLTQS